MFLSPRTQAITHTAPKNLLLCTPEEVSKTGVNAECMLFQLWCEAQVPALSYAPVEESDWTREMQLATAMITPDYRME